MSKVRCEEPQCKHSKDGVCVAKEINISPWLLHRLKEGSVCECICRTFEMRESTREIYEQIKEVFNG